MNAPNAENESFQRGTLLETIVSRNSIIEELV